MAEFIALGAPANLVLATRDGAMRTRESIVIMAPLL
jgi:hypothetical protein